MFCQQPVPFACPYINEASNQAVRLIVDNDLQWRRYRLAAIVSLVAAIFAILTLILSGFSGKIVGPASTLFAVMAVSTVFMAALARKAAGTTVQILVDHNKKLISIAEYQGHTIRKTLADGDFSNSRLLVFPVSLSFRLPVMPFNGVAAAIECDAQQVVVAVKNEVEQVSKYLKEWAPSELQIQYEMDDTIVGEANRRMH